MLNIAEVVVSITSSEVDKIFDYIIPDLLLNDLKVGMRVIVPFGRQNKKTEGFITSIKDNSDFEKAKLKSILHIQDSFPLFSENMITLAKWMKEKYYTSLYNCLKCIMPSGINMKSDFVISVINKKMFQKKQMLF